ncbi:hypothetical protein A4H97_32755 [Niastella yeongjuensis]|uniref:TonB-dependent receptor plug domain-containing protein n=1 Tax=Niastella yeongjuensis TaxID=354355 RepID=A0A1V9EGN6_9BACT|nr:hypothetical protein A4H97_32755 [Niastella yeongjuensis]
MQLTVDSVQGELAPPITISGKVFNTKGEPLSGANVNIKGTVIGAIVNNDGEFTLRVPDETVVLVISYQGYRPTEVRVRNNYNPSIVLETVSENLNEVVVLGYTSIAKRELTGAVSSLNPQMITRVQSNNLVQSLVGVPGLRVNGGASGVGDVRIRGNRSLLASNSPVIILDGMPYNESLNTIDQYDIASIDVLKDASATTLYGSKGSNGVIVITTKKALKGKTSITLDNYTGANIHVDGNLHPMNAEQYIQFKRDANQAVGIWNSPADDPKIFTAVELAGFGKVNNTAAQDYYNKLGFQTNSTLTIMNGGEKGSQKISLNFFDNKDRANTGYYNRYMLTTNIDQQVTKRLKVGVNGRLSYEFRQNSPGIGGNLLRYPPTVDFYDSTGQLITAPLGDPNMRNPLLDLNRDHNDSRSKAWVGLLKAYASYRFSDALTFSTNASLNAVFTWAGSYVDNQSATYSNALNKATIDNENKSFIAWNNVLNFKKHYGDHSIDATAVFELQNQQDFSSDMSGMDITLSQYKWYNIEASLQNQTISSNFLRTQMLSYVGRVQYGYKDRYLLSLTARSDGASQLAPGYKWQSFPAVGFAWRASDEQFMKTMRFIDDLKFRASYGVSGNNSIAAYATQGSLTTRYTIFGSTNGDIPYATNEPNQQPVPNLKWESTKSLNLGADFTLLHNRISGTFNYFISNTYDLLNRRKLPYTTGFNTVFDNIGKSRNRGYEIQLTGNVIEHRDLTLNVTMSFYHNKEELTELYDPRLTQDIANGWFVGYPVSDVTYDYTALGIWQTKEAAVAAIYGRTPGEIKIKDLNGDGKIDGNDRSIVGVERPTLQSSLIANLTWKHFDAAVDFYSEYGAIANDANTGSTFGGSIGRYNVSVIDYWTPTNPTNNAPQPRAGTSIAYLNTIGRHSNDYVRLRNATIGYTFSKGMLKGIEKLRIYGAVTNPWQYWSFLHEGGLSDRTIIANLGVNVSF